MSDGLRTCAFCGRAFVSLSKKAKTCSERCSKSHFKEKRYEEGVCYTCGANPRKPTSLICQECTDIGVVRKRRSRAGKPAEKTIRSIEKCAWCNAEFTPKTRVSRYCSPKCNGAHARQRALDAGLCGKCRKRPKRKTSSLCDECTIGSRKRPRDENRAKNAILIAIRKDLAITHIPAFLKPTSHPPPPPKPPPPTPKELLALGVGLKQQIRQMLGVRKGGDDDPFSLL